RVRVMGRRCGLAFIFLLGDWFNPNLSGAFITFYGSVVNDRTRRICESNFLHVQRLRFSTDTLLRECNSRRRASRRNRRASTLEVEPGVARELRKISLH